MHYGTLEIATIVVIGTSILGVFLWGARDFLLLRGYERVTAVAFGVQKLLKGTIFRDGRDLVIAGTFKGLPTVIRFSDNLNTPALNLRIGISSTFLMWVIPRSSTERPGRYLVPTEDERFEKRFALQTNDPAYVGALIDKDTVAVLRTLVRSGDSYLSFTEGLAELSETSLPYWVTTALIRRYLTAFARLSNMWEQLPGAEKVHPRPMPKDRLLAVRSAIVAGVVMIFMIAPYAPQDAAIATVRYATSINATDQALIPDMAAWRPAKEDYFDRDLLAWARLNGGTPGTALAGEYGKDHQKGHVYALLRSDGAGRVVAIIDGRNVYDATFPGFALLVNARSDVSGSPTPALEGADGDGFAILQKSGGSTSAILVFFREGKSVAIAVDDHRHLKVF